MSIKFKIQSIESERRIDGNTFIEAITIDNDEEILIEIAIKNTDLQDKIKIRKLLIEGYNRYKKAKSTEKSVQIGDLI